MSCLPRGEAAMTAGWCDLGDELDRWGAAGRAATLWWRDDDAVEPTPRLADLLRLADGIPLALAVIPAGARAELADALAAAPQCTVLQHGWRHANHAAIGKKSEYPAGRPPGDVSAEIGAGRARLAALFGERALPVLVPPWNRLADEFLALLPESGIAALSTMAAPRQAALPDGLVGLDVHVDPVAWHDGRGFVGTAPVLGRLVRHLRAAREEGEVAPRPIGLLTHHLMMDRATTAFLDRLVAMIRGHAAARWVAPAALLGDGTVP